MTEDVNGVAPDNERVSLTASAAERHIPLVGMFELTARCNLHCKMCYVHMSEAEIAASDAKELTARQWLSLAEQAVEAGTLYLTLTGGEPLIRDDFEEIYTGLAMMGLRLGINTNAALISPKYERLFSKYPPHEFLVTIYGADAETYRRVCGNSAAFDNVIKGLEVADGLSSRLKIRSTFIKDNKDQLKRLRDLAYRFRAELGINPLVNMPRTGVSSDVEGCRLSAAECADIAEEYNDLTSDGALFDGIELKREGERDPTLDVYPGILTCYASKSMYQIKRDGKMVPCLTFASLYTLPLEEGFTKAWNRLPEMLKDLRRPEKCRDCEHSGVCTVCPAAVEAETGSFDKVPEYICGITSELIARNMV